MDSINSSSKINLQQIVSDWKVETGVDKTEKFQADYNKLQNEMKERRMAAEKRRMEAARASRRNMLEHKKDSKTW